jgi:molybdenum cofactor cytidylyltransferase
MRTGAVILAAGCSSRMGRPKQSLRYGGMSLLRGSAEAALAAGCNPVCVVLGAWREELSKELAGLHVRVVENSEWQLGMGGSIRCGVETAIAREPLPDALLVMLSDQPLVGPEALRRLIAAGEDALHDIVASKYADTVGVPALFQRSLFRALIRLDPAEGAKKMLRDPRHNTMAIALPEAETDIDTPEDYRLASERGEAWWKVKTNRAESTAGSL